MSGKNETVDRIQVIWNMIGGDDGADALIKGRAKLKIIKVRSIDWIDALTVPSTSNRFIAREKFCINSREVKFHMFSDAFREHFVSCEVRILPDSDDERTFHFGDLTEKMTDNQIFSEICDGKVETTLSNLYHVLKRQDESEDGLYLTTRKPNIFFVRNFKGLLCTISVEWFGCHCGWGIGVVQRHSQNAWPDGSRIFSRNRSSTAT